MLQSGHQQHCHGGGSDRDNWAVGPGLCVQSCPFSGVSQQVISGVHTQGRGRRKVKAALLLHRVPWGFCARYPALTTPFGELCGVWLITEGKGEQNMVLQDMSWITGVRGAGCCVTVGWNGPIWGCWSRPGLTHLGLAEMF